jgi:hypothetical protein
LIEAAAACCPCRPAPCACLVVAIDRLVGLLVALRGAHASAAGF